MKVAYLKEIGFLSSKPLTTTPVAPPDLTAKTYEKVVNVFVAYSNSQP